MKFVVAPIVVVCQQVSKWHKMTEMGLLVHYFEGELGEQGSLCTHGRDRSKPLAFEVVFF